VASLGIAKIRRRSALILPLALNLIRHVSRWGEHEMRDFMRVSLATGADSSAPAAWDRGVWLSLAGPMTREPTAF
jgi:hypothetical protein